MSVDASPFLVYLGHYLLARLLYEDFVRPLAHGRAAASIIAIAAVALVSFALGRRTGRRRT